MRRNLTNYYAEDMYERDRARDSGSHLHCYANDGKSLTMVEDRSVDFAFTFDSMPPAERA
jgi:hypothetical protein